MLDKQAERITVLKLTGLSDISDYLILCSGHSTRQNQAICDEIASSLGKEHKMKPFNIEGTNPGDWILLDYIDFIVHIFMPDMRDRYSLEKMWMDAKRYDFFLD
jgi:ribosome-associated protein